MLKRHDIHVRYCLTMFGTGMCPEQERDTRDPFLYWKILSPGQYCKISSAVLIVQYYKKLFRRVIYICFNYHSFMYIAKYIILS